MVSKDIKVNIVCVESGSLSFGNWFTGERGEKGERGERGEVTNLIFKISHPTNSLIKIYNYFLRKG